MKMTANIVWEYYQSSDDSVKLKDTPFFFFFSFLDTPNFTFSFFSFSSSSSNPNSPSLKSDKLAPQDLIDNDLVKQTIYVSFYSSSYLV